MILRLKLITLSDFSTYTPIPNVMGAKRLPFFLPKGRLTS